MAEKKKVYWDACIWFALIKQEPGRMANCEHVLDLAKRGEVEIWTSSLTLAEVFRKQCGGPTTPANGLPEDKDVEFEAFVAQDFVVEVQVDHQIGIAARRLLRQHTKLRKPQDAIHLASALQHDLDEFHTFDRDNLLGLDGLVHTQSGRTLKICEPPAPPPPQPDLFTMAESAQKETAAPEGEGAAASASPALLLQADKLAE